MTRHKTALRRAQPRLTMLNLPSRVLDYTHYPEAVDPSHPINRHWFVYRREATVTQDFERKFTDDATVRLLYGEVGWTSNVFARSQVFLFPPLYRQNAMS